MSSRVVYQGVIRRCQAPLLFLLLAVATFPPALAAAGERSEGVDLGSDIALQEIVMLARRDNPALRAARAGWEASRERSAGAGALPNPMFLYGGMDEIGSFGFPDTDQKRFEVEQRFPWFGKRRLASETAEKEAEIAGADLAEMEREVALQVRESYYALYAVQRILAITQAEEAVLHRMNAAAEAKYATGESGLQDALEAQTELTLWKARILDLEREETVTAARLNRLIGRDPDTPIGRAVTAPPSTAYDADSLFALARETRPELERARIAIEASSLRRDLARKDYYPDYRVGAEYRSLDGVEDMAMFRIGIDLPVWRGKYRAGVREAEKALDASRAELADMEARTAYEVREAHAAWETARQTRDLYETALLPQADVRFQASEAAYRTGRADFLDLLESERFLLNARVLVVLAERELGVQAARLERAVGTDPAADRPREE